MQQLEVQVIQQVKVGVHYVLRLLLAALQNLNVGLFLQEDAHVFHEVEGLVHLEGDLGYALYVRLVWVVVVQAFRAKDGRVAALCDLVLAGELSELILESLQAI